MKGDLEDMVTYELVEGKHWVDHGFSKVQHWGAIEDV